MRQSHQCERSVQCEKNTRNERVKIVQVSVKKIFKPPWNHFHFFSFNIIINLKVFNPPS